MAKKKTTAKKKKPATPQTPKPKKKDFEILDPKKYFCDRVLLAFGEEEFVLGLQSGGVIDAQYVFTPKHAKRLLIALERNIKKYEKEFEKIKTTLPDNK